MVLSIEHVSKKYGTTTAVDDLSLTLTPGIYGLLGPNGAGKTTLMRIICSILRPTSGRVLWAGESILDMGEKYRRLLGYLPQDFGYYPEFTVEDFMNYMACLKGMKKGEARKYISQALQSVGLNEDRRHAKIRTLSGGLKQRLGIAQAILANPDLLVLDEPTAGLDPKERVRFRNLVTTIAQDRIVLLCTHIVSDVDTIADQVIIMNNGALTAHGTPEQVAALAQGRTWRTEVSPSELNRIDLEHCITDLRYSPTGNAIIRTVGPYPPTPDAESISPTLEDYYLDAFNETQAGTTTNEPEDKR
ncbi:ABC transporter ATP-binding protein [Schaalia vaccimaxillae]|uniref:ABC transporter ATP-binding protein n=1 Tax=Schaalia vaccimaxillae TaxID=183916 RepID=UPI0003B696E2|nr:ABC transporter ATP-binding protein [Schaalia vaccimaxillae]